MRRFPITQTIHDAILEGIEQHARGEVAVDPMTGALVPPPKPGHDEDVGWFLDDFSSGESKRHLAKGASRPVRDVITMAAISIGVSALSIIYALHRAHSLSTDPGALTSAIVEARRRARDLRLPRDAPWTCAPPRLRRNPADVVRAHLGEAAEAAREGTPKRAAG